MEKKHTRGRKRAKCSARQCTPVQQVEEDEQKKSEQHHPHREGSTTTKLQPPTRITIHNMTKGRERKRQSLAQLMLIVDVDVWAREKP